MRRMRLAAPLMLGLAAAAMPALQARAQISISFSVTVAPPFLPVYAQPPLPAQGYIWAPGYWAWDNAAGYYWVPGTWVLPPQPGLLWTPGYWGYDGLHYRWHDGYWGQHVGFYGGVNYGYGYFGNGYQGGYWQHDNFYYNRNVNNFGNMRVYHAYDRPVSRGGDGRVSYNGGNGGIPVRPSQQEMDWRNQQHVEATANQRRQEQMAARNRDMFAAQNHGVPPIAATRRPADFTSHNIERASNAPVPVPGVPRPGNPMMPQRPDQGMMQQRPNQGVAPQRPNQGVAPQRPYQGMAPQRQNPSMMPQRPDQGAQQRPDQGMMQQRAPNMMAPQRPQAPMPYAVTPGGGGMNRTQGMNAPQHMQQAPRPPAQGPQRQDNRPGPGQNQQDQQNHK